MHEIEVQFGEFLRSARSYAEAYETLRRSISAIVRVDRGVTAYYVGKGSGPNATFAMWRRHDDKKLDWEFTEIWALFESTSRARIGALEDALNDHYMRVDPHRCRNSGKGSAGRRSGQPRHYLYLALRRH